MSGRQFVLIVNTYVISMAKHGNVTSSIYLRGYHFILSTPRWVRGRVIKVSDSGSESGEFEACLLGF